MALDHNMNCMFSGYSNNRDADFGFNLLYSNGPVNNCGIGFNSPYSNGPTINCGIGFNPPYSNGPVNNCGMIDMCCGPPDLFVMQMSDPVDRLPHDPFGMGTNMHSSFNAAFSDFVGGFGSRFNSQIAPGPANRRSQDNMNMHSSFNAPFSGFVGGFESRFDNRIAPGPANRRNQETRNMHSSFNAAFSGFIGGCGSRFINQNVPELANRRSQEHSSGFVGGCGSRFVDQNGPETSNNRNQESSFFAGFDNWMREMKAPSGDSAVGDQLIEGFSYSLKNQSFCDPSEQSTDLDAPSRETLNSHMAVEEISNPNQDGGVHEGLFYVLGYLGVKDLLNVKRVCKSLHQAVETDPLLWREIQIDSTLSERITDEALLEITQKAQGNLRALTLVSCTKITDEGLRRVLEINPKITKLYVPECARLNLDTLIKNLKTLKSSGNAGIKHLKLGRLFSVSEEQYKELTTLLNTDPLCERLHQKPRFYHIARFSMSCDADRALDLEPCPICQKFKLVYDCPIESCLEGKEGACGRACESCVLRCVQCGKCIRDNTYAETFSFEYLCTACWNQPALF